MAERSFTGSAGFPKVFQSKSIFLNNGTITQVKITIPNASGTFIFAITADGSTYENVVPGVDQSFSQGITHIFNNSGVNVKYRIAANAGVTISSPQDENDNFSPAVQIERIA